MGSIISVSGLIHAHIWSVSAYSKKRIKYLTARCEEAQQQCAQLQLSSRYPEINDPHLDLVEVVTHICRQEIQKVTKARSALGQDCSSSGSPPLPPTGPLDDVPKLFTNRKAEAVEASAFQSQISVPSSSFHAFDNVSSGIVESQVSHVSDDVMTPSRAGHGAYVPLMGLPIPQQKPLNPRPPSIENETGHVVVDRNDERGTWIEYRNSRKPRH